MTCGFDMGDWRIGPETERTHRTCQREPHTVDAQDRETWHRTESEGGWLRMPDHGRLK